MVQKIIQKSPESSTCNMQLACRYPWYPCLCQQGSRMVPMKVTVSYLYYELYNQKTSITLITSIAEFIELKDSRIATADLG